MEAARGEDSSPTIDRYRVGMRAVDEIRQREYDKLCVSEPTEARIEAPRTKSAVNSCTCEHVAQPYVMQQKNQVHTDRRDRQSSAYSNTDSFVDSLGRNMPGARGRAL